MRSTSLPLLPLALLGFFSLGASCNNNGKDTSKTAVDPSAQPSAPEAQKAEAKSSKIDKLDRIDTSELTSNERRTFFEVVNDALSPCGEPISVAQCVAESRSCRACVPGARYVVRLVADGHEKSEILELYASRFDPKRKVSIDTANAPVRGAPMAKVSIVEFSDFECPHCGAAHPLLQRVLEEFDGKVNLVFKNFPLDSHKNAAPAARAATAAQAQGKFWELADQLFEHQRELSADSIHDLAKKVGLDMTKWETDFASPAVQQHVERDKQDGINAGVQGTPSLFIDGRAYKEGLQSLDKYLKEELEL